MDKQRVPYLAAGGLVLATALLGAVTSRAGVGGSGDGSPSTFTAATSGGISFRGTLDRTKVLRGRDGVMRMELVMAAAPGDDRRVARRPIDMVIVLDRSGSMAGEKLEHARAAIRSLLGSLGDNDRFALVTYSDDAAVSVPLARADEPSRRRWSDTLAEIREAGGTNLASGLDLGLAVIERNRSTEREPRLLLISDGLANQGDATHEGLTGRARRAAASEYMLSTIGVGTDFNEYLMTALADAGTGNYYYVRHASELAAVFVSELGGARATVAGALAVRIDPAPGVQVVDAAGYPLEKVGDSIVFRPGALFAGQERRIWVTLSVPHESEGQFELGRVSLAYNVGEERKSISLDNLPRVACVQAEDDFYEGVNVSAWSRSLVVDAYNKMQQDVAREVKAGKRDEALQRLRAFKEEAGSMNKKLGSEAVADQLGRADKLEADVASAFAGPKQAQRQNELSKAASASAVDARRAGSKK